MKIGFYSRIAWNNIKKNGRLYLPNILAGMGLAAVFYIILTLAMDNRLGDVRSSRSRQSSSFCGGHPGNHRDLLPVYHRHYRTPETDEKQLTLLL
jgi:hypothetical protein